MLRGKNNNKNTLKGFRNIILVAKEFQVPIRGHCKVAEIGGVFLILVFKKLFLLVMLSCCIIQ